MSIGNTPPYPFVWDGSRRINPNDYNNIIFNLTGSQIKSGSFQVNGPVYITGSLILTGSTNIGLASNVNVQNNAVPEGTQNTINFISGSGVNLSITNNPSAGRVDITLSTGSGIGTGGGTSGYNAVQNQGTLITPRTTLDFVGNTVAASDDSVNSRTLVTVASYGTTPSSVTIGSSAAPGSLNSIARTDHIHGAPSQWTPTSHASTHYVGGTDPLTGSLTISSLQTTGNIIAGGNATITGSLNITGSLTQLGNAHISGSLIVDSLETLNNGLTVTAGNINATTGTTTLGQTSATILTATSTSNLQGASNFGLGGNNTTSPVTLLAGTSMSIQSGSITISTGSVTIPTENITTSNITKAIITSLVAGIITGSTTTLTGSLTINSGSNINILSGSLVGFTGSSFVLSGSANPSWRLNTLGKVDWLSGIGTNLVTGSVVQVNVKFGAPTDSDYINPQDGLLVVDNQHNTLWERTSGAWIQVTGSAGGTGSGPHTILSATHTDTLPAAVVAGDLMVGNSTPAWARFPIGTTGQYIGSTGGAPVWSGSQNIYITGSYVGNGTGLNFFSGSGIIITGSTGNNNVNLLFNTGSSVATLLSTGLVPTNELATGAASAAVFLRGDQTWAAPPSGVSNVRYASVFASAGGGTSGSPWTGWDSNTSGVFANMPALPQPVTIIFEPGWFQAATGSVPINRSYVSIMGYGPESVIKFPGYGTGFTWGGITGSNNTGSYSQIAVSGLHLIGNNLPDLSGSYQEGLFLSGVYDFWISGNWGELFGLTGSPTATEVQGAGIYVGSGSKRGHIIGNRFSQNKLAGISINGNNNIINDLDYTEDIQITGNICDQNHRVGIHLLNDVRGITITGNICRSNEEAGISLENLSGKNETFGPKFITVESNTCYRNLRSVIGGTGSLQGGYGIDLFGAQDCIVNGNTCNENSGSGANDASTGVGIRVLADAAGIAIARRNIISDNVVDNNQGSGIRLETNNANFGPTNTTIVNNIISGNGVSGAGLGIDLVSAGTIANSGSILSDNYIYNNAFGSIAPPSGLINSIIKSNVGYNPTLTSSLNFVTTVATTKSGVPADSDFLNPQDGQIATNTAANTFYFRSNAVWRQVTGGGGGGITTIEPSYLVFSGSGGIYNALNGYTGVVDFANSNFATVMNSSINALPNGGLIFIKRGTYPVTASIVPTQTAHAVGSALNGLTIMGEGDGTILQLQANGVTIIKNTGSEQDHLVISGLMFDGNTANFSGSGIDVYPVQNRIINCRFRNFRSDAVILESFDPNNFGFYNLVADCGFENINANGIRTNNCDSNVFTHNFFDTVLGININSQSGTDTITDNVMNINAHSGNAGSTPMIYVGNPVTIVANNTIGGNGDATGGIGIGIYLDNSGNSANNVTVTNNIITLPQQYGIFLAGGSSENIITNNIIAAVGRSASNTYSGIFLGSGVDNIVTGNIVDGQETFTSISVVSNMKNGIEESAGASQNIITNNFISGSIGPAILISATTDRVKDNIGFNPQGMATISVTASPFTYTNNDSVSEAIYIQSGSVSNISKNGINILNSSPATVWLEPKEAIIVTYSSAPTMAKDRK